jgi:Vitamin K epoxide reductase family
MPFPNRATLLALGAGLVLAPGRPLVSQGPMVHAVLFYSPTCPHCHRVIGEDLPQIFAQFGGPALLRKGTAGHVVGNGTVEILLVDVSFPEGLAAYEAVGQRLHITNDGVPRLVCGDSVLVGDGDIPAFFPGLIEHGLDRGGVGWPAIDGLDRLFPAGYAAAVRVDTVARADTADATRKADTAVPAVPVDSARTAVPAAKARRPAPGIPTGKAERADTAAPSMPADTVRPRVPVDTAVPSVMDLVGNPSKGQVIGRTFHQDPIGVSLAVVLILAMSFSLTWLVFEGPSDRATPAATVPALLLVGVCIAAYLAYVEMSGVRAVCGPVGDCNAVQQSAYAKVFGVPVALGGIVGYVAILAAWTFARRSRGTARLWARRAVLALTVVGTVGSLLLTILEPFVIGAVCLWCCGSAAVMTALLWTAPAVESDASAAPTAHT